MWGEITYPFPNVNVEVVDVWEWISNFTSRFTVACEYYPCWGFVTKIFAVSERGPWANVKWNGVHPPRITNPFFVNFFSSSELYWWNLPWRWLPLQYTWCYSPRGIWHAHMQVRNIYTHIHYTSPHTIFSVSICCWCALFSSVDSLYLFYDNIYIYMYIYKGCHTITTRFLCSYILFTLDCPYFVSFILYV